MKINKNSTLAFIGGVMLASSSSMFAAGTVVSNSDASSKSTRTEIRHSRGHKGYRAENNASSTMHTNNHVGMMGYADIMNYGGVMKNMTGAEKQVIKDKIDTDLAQILGISKETLLSKINAGTAIQQMIKDAGMTQEQFHTKMEVLRKADLEKVLADQVKSGKITQAKADEIKAKMTQREENKKAHMGHASSTTVIGKMMSGWFH